MGAEPGRAPRHRATDRVIDILELAAASREGLALKDVSRGVETPKSSLLPLLRTLTARGYLEQGRAGEYRLGPKAVELGTRSRGRRDLVETARPALEALMRRTGETVFLATLTGDGTGIAYVDKVESEQIIRYSSGVGDRRPLHATASGKAILAFLPEPRRAEILESLELVRYTERTIATCPRCARRWRRCAAPASASTSRRSWPAPAGSPPRSWTSGAPCWRPARSAAPRIACGPGSAS